MKKLFTIVVAMGALLFVSAAANAQSGSRNMEKRDQYNDRGNQNNQRGERINERHHPKLEVVFGVGSHRGYNRYNDYGRRNRYERSRHERRRYEHNRYHRSHRRNRY